MKLSDYIAQFLVKNKVDTVFGYQGGNVAHLIDSINKQNNIKFISTYNEQSASYAACSYALSKDNIGVALASSGPGAINLLSGIANAFYDSIPCIFFTGNVSAHTIKTSENIRQNGFQENDIVSMVKKITKYAVTVLNPEDIRFHIEKALFLAKNGRPGPVLLDLPHNVQKIEILPDKLKSYESRKEEKRENLRIATAISEPCPSWTSNDESRNTDSHYTISKTINNIIDIVAKAKKPLILAGGGLVAKDSRKLFHELLKKWKIPVVTTLRGLDLIPHNSELFAGFGGAYGNRSANLAIYNSDVLIVLGSRLDERFIATADKSLFNNKKIIHIDIDEYELKRIFQDEIAINCKVETFLELLLQLIKDESDFSKWISTVNKWKKRYPSSDIKNSYFINNIIQTITDNSKDSTIFTADVGLNQMCLAQSAIIKQNQRLYTSSGLGAMGCSLPLAIGAAYATEKKTSILCFVGDGGLHMNIQDLLMIKKEKLPIQIILLNNGCLGMIRDFQTKAFNSSFVGTVNEFQNINYKAIAEAYNLSYNRITNESEVENFINTESSDKPDFTEIVLPVDSNTMPLLGRDMFSGIPELSEEEQLLIKQEVTECENTTY